MFYYAKLNEDQKCIEIVIRNRELPGYLHDYILIPEFDEQLIGKKYDGKQWIGLTKNQEIKYKSQKDKINQEVVNKIREKYSINDELKMLRLGNLDLNNIEYRRYLNYVTNCVKWGRQEKEKYNF